ncbi:4-hydroxymandelate oxidase [Marmoricola sp. OAE513]|uniref:alpha-hydroxy acid oxidase n=1 Tax=Marmoricola sp. OAE513 TaxID=2817894 RepID=UPI001AEA3AAA
MSGPATGSSWLASLEEQARAKLPAEVYRYYRQGSRESTSADEATAAWERHRLVPRIFADVREVDLSTDFLGRTSRAPFGIAPTTLQRAAHPDGEVAVAAAATSAGLPMVVSSNAGSTLAEIAATGVHWWLQAYLPQDRALARPMLEAAVEAGASAVVLTVDTPVVATKYDGGAVWGTGAADQVRLNLGAAAEAPKARDLGPADITWLRETTGLPVVAKGVLGPQAAHAAVVAGAAAVWVSNHGGRQLDRAVATADALHGVAARVNGQVPVYVDGGVRTGISALTALALGADGIFLGRLPLYALAVDGAAGVGKMFADLTAELVEALVLAGCRRPGDARGIVPGTS